MLTVVGARLHFVKAAPVSRALARAGVHQILVHTGQHYDDVMPGVFLSRLGLREAHWNLGIGLGPHVWQTGRMLEGGRLPGTPVVVLRDETEWVELVACGAARLGGTAPARIAIEATAATWPATGLPSGLFGDGHAADVVATCVRDLAMSGQELQEGKK